MAHYAKVQNGKVVKVIVADPDFFSDFVDDSPGRWVQTSYNTHGGVHYGANGESDGGTPLRKNYAGVGYTYDATRDAFIPPQPYPSWVLDEETCLWAAPTPMPDDGAEYVWDESTKKWVPVSNPYTPSE